MQNTRLRWLIWKWRALAANARALLQIDDPNDRVDLFMMRVAAQNVEPFNPKLPPVDADQ